MDIANRIKTIRGKIPQGEFAQKAGVHKSSLGRYERGDSLPDSNFLSAVCSVFDINPQWLLLGIGPMRGEEGKTSTPQRRSTDLLETVECADTELTLIPMVEAVLSAGNGSFEVSAESEKKYAFRSDFLRRKGNASEMVLMRVDGDSMEPHIRSGDVVLIDQSQKALRPGRIYAVGVEDMVFLKIVSAQPGKVVLHSLNSEMYPPLEVDTRGDLEDSVRIVGRCLWFCREL